MLFLHYTYAILYLYYTNTYLQVFSSGMSAQAMLDYHYTLNNAPARINFSFPSKKVCLLNYRFHDHSFGVLDWGTFVVQYIKH